MNWITAKPPLYLHCLQVATICAAMQGFFIQADGKGGFISEP